MRYAKTSSVVAIVLGLSACQTTTSNTTPAEPPTTEASTAASSPQSFSSSRDREELIRAVKACERSMQTGEDLSRLLPGYSFKQKNLPKRDEYTLRYAVKDRVRNSFFQVTRKADSCKVVHVPVRIRNFRSLGLLVQQSIPNSNPSISLTTQNAGINVEFEQ